MGKDYQPESHMSPRDKKEIIRLYYRTLKENVPSQVSKALSLLSFFHADRVG